MVNNQKMYFEKHKVCVCVGGGDGIMIEFLSVTQAFKS